MKTKTLSLDDLNLVDPCEQPYEFEYVDQHGQKSGVFISVLGSESSKLKAWTLKQINARKKNEDEATAEDNLESGIEGIAYRIVGWRGITQECTPKNAILLCTTNRLIREQVLKNSEKLGNFTKSK